MADYDHRNQAFDYVPPSRGGNGTGALVFIGGIVVLFIVAVIFMGSGGDRTLPAQGTAPAVTPADGVPSAVD